jgi:hypothetical protein
MGPRVRAPRHRGRAIGAPIGRGGRRDCSASAHLAVEAAVRVAAQVDGAGDEAEALVELEDVVHAGLEGQALHLWRAGRGRGRGRAAAGAGGARGIVLAPERTLTTLPSSGSAERGEDASLLAMGGASLPMTRRGRDGDGGRPPWQRPEGARGGGDAGGRAAGGARGGCCTSSKPASRTNQLAARPRARGYAAGKRWDGAPIQGALFAPAARLAPSVRRQDGNAARVVLPAARRGGRGAGGSAPGDAGGRAAGGARRAARARRGAGAGAGAPRGAPGFPGPPLRTSVPQRRAARAQRAARRGLPRTAPRRQPSPARAWPATAGPRSAAHARRIQRFVHRDRRRARVGLRHAREQLFGIVLAPSRLRFDQTAGDLLQNFLALFGRHVGGTPPQLKSIRAKRLQVEAQGIVRNPSIHAAAVLPSTLVAERAISAAEAAGPRAAEAAGRVHAILGGGHARRGPPRGSTALAHPCMGQPQPGGQAPPAGRPGGPRGPPRPTPTPACPPAARFLRVQSGGRSGARATGRAAQAVLPSRRRTEGASRAAGAKRGPWIGAPSHGFPAA